MRNKAYRLAKLCISKLSRQILMRNQNRTSLGQGILKQKKQFHMGRILPYIPKLARDWIYNAEDQRLLILRVVHVMSPYVPI